MTRRRPRSDIGWGVRQGLILASGYSLWVLLLSVVRGSTSWPQYHTTAWVIIGGYFLVGLTGGALVGALLPVTAWRVGTFVVGWMAGTVIYGGLGFVMGHLHDWWLGTIPGLAIGGLAVVKQDQERLGAELKTRWSLVAVLVALGTLLAVLMHLAGWW
jgi:hypothetical protein